MGIIAGASDGNGDLAHLYVTNRVSHTVTFYYATTGAYINGTLANSSFDTGYDALGVDLNQAEKILYVANGVADGSVGAVTFFDTATGKYLNGTLANSSFSTGLTPFGGIALNPKANILYVASTAVTFLNATTGAYLNGTLANSSFATGGAAIAVNPSDNILYVLNGSGVTFLNATTGAYINGTLANSTFPAVSNPFTIAVNPAANVLYVADNSAHAVAFLNATTGTYINGTLANSSFSTGSGTGGVMAMAVNPSVNILYVANSSGVTFLNARTGAYINGSLANSSFIAGFVPHGCAVSSALNTVFIVNEGSQTVTLFNATTGAYINGTLANSSFKTGVDPWAVAVDQ